MKASVRCSSFALFFAFPWVLRSRPGTGCPPHMRRLTSGAGRLGPQERRNGFDTAIGILVLLPLDRATACMAGRTSQPWGSSQPRFLPINLWGSDSSNTLYCWMKDRGREQKEGPIKPWIPSIAHVIDRFRRASRLFT